MAKSYEQDFALVADRLRRWREYRGLTVVELSKKSRVNQVTLYRIEHGQHTNVRLQTLHAIARALDVKLSKLLAQI